MLVGMLAGMTRARVVVALSLMTFAAWCVFVQALVTIPDRGNDFPAFYTAARAPLDRLYDLTYIGQYQKELRRNWRPAEIQPFPRAPVLALLFRPFGWFRYEVGLHLWLAVLSLAMAGCAWLLDKLYGGGARILLWMIPFYPISFALTMGQDSPLVLGPLLAALWFHRRGRDWLAALFLSLAFQKFHLLLLLPVALLLHRKRPLLFRFACWIAFWGALNISLVGPTGVRNYIGVLNAGVVDRLFVRSWNLRSLMFHLGWDEPGYVVGVVLVVIWFVWLARRLEFESAFWTAVGLSLVLAWHSYKYDYTLAFPFFYLLWREHRVRLAALFLFGGLWVHALTIDRKTWLMAPLVVAMTVDLWRRSRQPGVARHMTSTPQAVGVPTASH